MRILLGMSGGVDSAFSALLLRQMGHDVEGCTLVMHEYSECEEARGSANELGIKHHILDATESFNNIIKKNFVDEYSNGRTPNPCILCNEKVKFRLLLDYALSHGFDAIATGHYASVVKIADKQGERWAVGRASDLKKDQSYMLYRLPADILQRLILPLSDTTKQDVRSSSSEVNLAVARKKDSQEICFLPDGNYAEYIESVKGVFPNGNFVDTDGKVIGEHRGIIRYTVGQRKGLGISLGERAFVTKINPGNNEITLSTSNVGVTELILSEPVFSGIAYTKGIREARLLAKVRYTAPLVACTVFFEREDLVRVEFDAPVKAAPGQSCVLYDGDVIALGGIIK